MPIFSLLFRTTSMSDIGVIKPQNSVILKWLKHGFLDFIISLIVSLTVLWIVTSILHQGKNIKSVENIKSIKNNISNEISELKNDIEKLKTKQEIKTLEMKALKSELQLEIVQKENEFDIELDNLKKIIQKLQEEMPNEKATSEVTTSKYPWLRPGYPKIKEPNFK